MLLFTKMMLFKGLCNCHLKLASRAFSGTPAVSSKQWRLERGLPANRSADSALVDGPDYTFLDGRPTPLLHKQKERMLKQQGYASKIVEYCSDLDFAKERHQNMQRESEEERQRIISNRLKPKGSALSKRK